MNNNRNKYFNKKQWYKKKGTAKQNKEKAIKDSASTYKPSSPCKHKPDLSISKNAKEEKKYYAWRLYFQDKEFKDDYDDIVKRLTAIEQFIRRHQDLLLLLTVKNLEAAVTFNVDLINFYKDDIFVEQWPTFKIDIQEKPMLTISCLKLAMHQYILNTIPEERVQNVMDSIYLLPPIRIRLLNYQHTISLREIKVNSYGKLVRTRGCVIKMGRTKLEAHWFIFACSKCGTERLYQQPQGIYTLPKRCNACGVSSFHPVLDSPFTRCVPFQIIQIQEVQSNNQENKGQMPRVLAVKITDHLIDTCMPGDDITLVGIVKVQGMDDGTSHKGNVVSPYSLYIEAITILHNNSKVDNTNKNDNVDNRDYSGISHTSTTNVEINLKDYITIKEIYKKPNIFLLLIHSLCPDIYGNEMIKAGLVLSLFGGNSKRKKLRDHIHVLLIGDAGLGKSQILQACMRVAPKGIYVCGNTSTSSGLTVTLAKESGTNDYTLEPGALILADEGCCCIDEFDKMPTQHQALLESMEQQRISIAKSGVVCSLPSRTTIIAAANPVGGRYDRSKTLLQNLNISQPLLSRFDLVFLLLDKPNHQLDRMVCQHVMASHMGSRRGVNKNNIMRNSNGSSVKNGSLIERLLSYINESSETISYEILKKYILYAHQYVNPILSPEAAEVLQNYYLELRSKSKEAGGIPIYNRQLEAMVRLTEARAKLELRVEATKQDALEVIEILKSTILGTLENPIELKPLPTGNKLTEKRVKAFINLLQSEADASQQKTFTRTELKQLASNGGINLQDFTQLLSKLNDQGILLQVERNVYKLVII